MRAAATPYRVVDFVYYSLTLPFIAQILLVLLGFSVFYTGTENMLGSSRISTGFTILLIFQVGAVVVSTWLPICGELL